MDLRHLGWTELGARAAGLDPAAIEEPITAYARVGSNVIYRLSSGAVVLDGNGGQAEVYQDLADARDADPTDAFGLIAALEAAESHEAANCIVCGRFHAPPPCAA